MAAHALSRVARGIAPVIAVALLSLVALGLMGNAIQGSARFGELYSGLLLTTSLGLLFLAVLIGWNLLRLLGQVRHGRPGSRLTVRLVAVFSVLAFTPVLVVYWFSIQFLHKGIDSWFDVRIERALDDALELSRTALGVRMRELLKQTELMAADAASLPDGRLAVGLEDSRRLSGASEVTLLGPKGRVIASSNIDPTAIVPDRPDDTILMQLRQSGNYIGLDPIGNAGLHVRVVVGLPLDIPTAEPRVLQALFPVTERMNDLAEGVQSAYAKYRELAYLRRPLKLSFTLTLSLVLLVSLFTALWAALYSARRMVAPLRDLAEGTRAVAAGDYETQLPRSEHRDEVGFLVASFNEMTRRLALARDETRRSQRLLEEQRAYLAVVLARLSNGVVTLDPASRLHTANEAAAQILKLDLEAHEGQDLESMTALHPHLRPLADAVAAHLATGREGPGRESREELVLLGPEGRQVLLLSLSSLPGAQGVAAGHVLVFDDITRLVQAQRDAAWSEVARRLAHEIKNPLTPIQLSAERLRHKYLERMEGRDGETFDRLTRTIVQQVEAMKGMVNAFSDYARTPAMEARAMDLNDLLRDLRELYRGGGGAPIDLALDPDLAPIEADPDRLRQVLHNLVRNALEAQGACAGAIEIETRAGGEDHLDLVELRIRDHGPGIPEAILGRVFEPYVTTKARGTGLGLAIVKKIIDEHGGQVWAENHAEGGASVVVRLPPARHHGLALPPGRQRRAG